MAYNLNRPPIQASIGPYQVNAAAAGGNRSLDSMQVAPDAMDAQVGLQPLVGSGGLDRTALAPHPGMDYAGTGDNRYDPAGDAHGWLPGMAPGGPGVDVPGMSGVGLQPTGMATTKPRLGRLQVDGTNTNPVLDAYSQSNSQYDATGLEKPMGAYSFTDLPYDALRRRRMRGSFGGSGGGGVGVMGAGTQAAAGSALSMASSGTGAPSVQGRPSLIARPSPTAARPFTFDPANPEPPGRFGVITTAPVKPGSTKFPQASPATGFNQLARRPQNIGLDSRLPNIPRDPVTIPLKDGGRIGKKKRRAAQTYDMARVDGENLRLADGGAVTKPLRERGSPLTYADYVRHMAGRGGSEGGGTGAVDEATWNALSPQEQFNNLQGGMVISKDDPRYAAMAQQLGISNGSNIMIGGGAQAHAGDSRWWVNPNAVINGDGWSATGSENQTPYMQQQANASGLSEKEWIALAAMVAAGGALPPGVLEGGAGAVGGGTEALAGGAFDMGGSAGVFDSMGHPLYPGGMEAGVGLEGAPGWAAEGGAPVQPGPFDGGTAGGDVSGGSFDGGQAGGNASRNWMTPQNFDRAARIAGGATSLLTRGGGAPAAAGTPLPDIAGVGLPPIGAPGGVPGGAGGNQLVRNSAPGAGATPGATPGADAGTSYDLSTFDPSAFVTRGGTGNWEAARGRFAPIESMIFDEAAKAGSEGEQTAAAGRARSDVAQRYAQTRERAKANLVAQGFNPNDPRGVAGEMDRLSRLDEATASVGGQNAARLAEKDRGFGARIQAASVGNAAAGQALQADNIGLQRDLGNARLASDMARSRAELGVRMGEGALDRGQRRYETDINNNYRYADLGSRDRLGWDTNAISRENAITNRGRVNADIARGVTGDARQNAIDRGRGVGQVITGARDIYGLGHDFNFWKDGHRVSSGDVGLEPSRSKRRPKYRDGARVERRYEHGARVRGPGTSTSDSVHARLSDKEGVLNAEGMELLDATEPGKFEALNDAGLKIRAARQQLTANMADVGLGD